MLRTIRHARGSRAALVSAAAVLVVLSPWALHLAWAAPATVEVIDFSFEPASVSVRVGETVTWRWKGESPHSVTAPGVFDSHRDCTAVTPEACGTAGATFTWTPDEPGSVAYRCKVHPDLMQGSILVTAAAPSPSETAPPPVSPSPSETSPSPSSPPPPPSRPSPRPSAPDSPSPSPSPRFGPPSPTPTQPLPVVTPTGSPSPVPAPSVSEPELEPFPAPIDPTASVSEDPLTDDVVAVGDPGDDAGRIRAIAGVTFGVTVLAFARLVLFGRDWF